MLWHTTHYRKEEREGIEDKRKEGVIERKENDREGKRRAGEIERGGEKKRKEKRREERGK